MALTSLHANWKLGSYENDRDEEIKQSGPTKGDSFEYFFGTAMPRRPRTKLAGMPQHIVQERLSVRAA